MKYRIVSSCVAALVAITQGFCGVVKISVPDVIIAQGGTSNVVIHFDLGTLPYTAYQLDIAYPEGISSESDSEGNPLFIKGDVYSERHNVSSVYTDKGLNRFQCFSLQSDELTAQSGILLNLPIKAQKTMPEGTYQVTISPIEFVQTDATPGRPNAITANIRVVMPEKLVTNRYKMAKGWNWVSTNIATEAVPYISPIEDKVSRLVSQTYELFNDPNYGIVGALKTLDVISAYKLLTTEETTLEQYGVITTPSEASVQLKAGWNWIGYLPSQTLSVATALSNLQVANGDRLVSQGSFAIYGDNGWEGSLEAMNPGEGYIYFRTTDATAFNYPDKAENEPLYDIKRTLSESSNNAPWGYDIHRFPDVTTIVARLYMEDRPLNLSNYSVGVFCGDECRGVGQQVGDKLFITVHGTVADKEDIVFCAYEHASGETLLISETITFLGQMLGDLNNPMKLHIQSGATGIYGIPTLPDDTRAIYSPAGRLLHRLQQGVNIIINADGTTQKVLVK